MYIIKDFNELIVYIADCRAKAQAKSTDNSNLKKEQAYYRGETAAYAHVLEILTDYQKGQS